MRGCRARAGVIVWFLALWTVAIPALADSAAPTTYRSEVTDLVPGVESVEVQVVGGDAFLRISVQEGTEVEIPGYEGEPYLRIDADGEVEANRNAPTYWLNEDRFGRTRLPSGVSTEAPPRWETVARGGSYGWHDHRIHWMSPDPPPAVDRSTRSVLYEWRVPILVDGEEVDVMGVLEWVPSVSPVPWILLALAVAAAVLWLGRPREGVVAGGSLATVVALAQAMESPLGLWQETLVWLPPAATVALGLVPSSGRRGMLLGAATALLIVWSVLRVASLWLPVLPSPLPEPVERTVVAVAIGAGLGALVVLYRRLAPTA